MKKYFLYNKTDDPTKLPGEPEHEDIALILLDKPFPRHMTDGRKYLINTVCLPTKEVSSYAHQMATFYGFGLIEHWSQWLLQTAVHEKLLKGSKSIYSCNEWTMFCADWEDEDHGARPCFVSCLLLFLYEIHMKTTLLGRFWRTSRSIRVRTNHFKRCANRYRPIDSAWWYVYRSKSLL